MDSSDTKKYKEADFETAISQAGFGKFNILLLLLAVPSFFASNFDSTIMSYVLPVAHCDLEMNLQQRGVLVGIPYLGMVVSGFMWGFLADTLGRKKIVVSCYTVNALIIILAGFSQTFEMLVTLKFITGFIINGPFVTLTSLLSEFHSAKHRAQVVIGIGVIYGIANVIVPLLAWLIIPMDWSVQVTSLNFRLNSWNFFIMISSFPSIISAIGHLFVPESPKYLMTAGKNDQALKVFQTVYCLNTGKSPDEYPVVTLIEEPKRRVEYKSSFQALKMGFQQIKPLFFKPYLINFLLICVMETGLIASMNSLRLWLPQIYTILTDYKTNFPEDSSASLCTMLETTIPRNLTLEPSECIESSTDSSVYINVVIVSSTAIFAFLITELSVNRVGKKPLLIILGLIGGTSGLCIYFGKSSEEMTALAAVNNALILVCTDIVMAITVDIFPTSLRTMTLAIVFTASRMGSLTANILFPILLEAGCLPPFLTIGSTALVCTLVTFLLPNTDNKALE